MALKLWNQHLVGGQVPTVHPFEKVINFYSDFRNENPENHKQADFSNWLLQNQHVNTINTANSYWYPFRPNQLGIGALTDEQVYLLAQDPQGRYARIFLYNWYRCQLGQDFPTCLANVYIVGVFRGQRHQGQELQQHIVDCGYANSGASVTNLISVGNGIGQYFGFLDANNLPTDFFRSFFQEDF